MALHTGEKTVEKSGANYVSNYNMFTGMIKNTLTHPTAYYCFYYNNVKKIELNGKIIFLWLDVKGQVNYSFNLLEKEFSTTSLKNLGTLLTSYFGKVIEVVNNSDEIMKKTTDRVTKVNRSITDFDKYNSYMEYIESFKTETSEKTKKSEIIDVDVEDNSPESLLNILSEKKQQGGQIEVYKDEPKFNQGQLYQRVIELSIYQLEYSHNTLYICSNELPVVHKEDFRPDKKEAFFYENGLLIRNTYFSTTYNTAIPFKENIDNSFTFRFVFHMAKKNINKAMDILGWFSNIVNFHCKLPCNLVLYAKGDEYINLFFEEIVVPVLNSEHCERIENTDLTKKGLCEKLDEKIICNFHNITAPTILDEKTKEFSRKLIHKDKYKINNKNVTTAANALITSTSAYIPLIANDVPSVVVDIESSIKILCEEMGIAKDYYVVANLIKSDLQNFSQIIRSIDMSKLRNTYNVNYYKNESYPDILDGDADLLRVFEASIKNRDIDIFESAIIDGETEVLVEELEIDLNEDRVCKQRLLDYFTILFGKQYKNNTAFIKALKLISRYKEKPFDSNKQFQIKGKVYYEL